MKFIWLIVITVILQQQTIQNPIERLKSKDEYIEINTDNIRNSCIHCSSQDYPIMEPLDYYAKRYKKLNILVSAIEPNIEEGKALFDAKKAVKFIDRLIDISNKTTNNLTYTSSVYKIGGMYVCLANGEINGGKKKSIKKLAPKVINVLVTALKSDDINLKDHSITCLYYIAQINNQNQLLDSAVKDMILMNIKQNISQARISYLGSKFQQVYDEFSK